MKITIIETGAKESLAITDPKSGVAYTSDLLGNHGALPDYNDDDGTYHMGQEDYGRWSDLIDAYQTADDRQHELLNSLTGSTYNDMSDEIQDINCDLEDLPDCINAICDKYEED